MSSNYDSRYATEHEYNGYECSHCETANAEKEETSEYVIQAVRQLYGTKAMNLPDLETAFNEICIYFGIEMHPGTLNVTRHIQKIYHPTEFKQLVERSTQQELAVMGIE